MKLILTADVEKIGSLGDVIDVKKGFARNFLLPRRLAVEVSEHNLALMEARKKKHLKKLEQEKQAASEQKQKLEGVAVTMRKKSGENGVLFGSVTTTEIERELAARGFSVEKKKIHLDEPIKRLGEYTAKIRLFHGVEAAIKVEVLKEEEDPA
ncbi:MAG: 50S ribosomal protein L9 [Acidobacteria bacterium]|jgi:large subunit ribosomal protein L9|nr:50S ribosomal protein L9 [Acidobacteriota bacterium]